MASRTKNTQDRPSPHGAPSPAALIRGHRPFQRHIQILNMTSAIRPRIEMATLAKRIPAFKNFANSSRAPDRNIFRARAQPIIPIQEMKSIHPRVGISRESRALRVNPETLFRMTTCAHTEGPPSQFTLGSIESVKIAFRWRILNDRDACQK